MSIEFEIPAEAKAIRERVRQWVQDECIPAEKELLAGARLQGDCWPSCASKARAQGLWCPSSPRNTAAWALARWPTPWCRWSWARAISARCR